MMPSAAARNIFGASARTCCSRMATRRRWEPVPASAVAVSYPGSIRPCTIGSMPRESSRCCFCAASRTSDRTPASADTSESHGAAPRPAEGTEASARAAVKEAWKASSAARTSSRSESRVAWRPERKARSHCTDTALRMGAVSASFMLSRKTPCRRVVALYVAQCSPPCVTEMPHAPAVESASEAAEAAPCCSCGATCVSKEARTASSAALHAALSRRCASAARWSYAARRESRVACGSRDSHSSSVSDERANSRIPRQRRSEISLRRTSACRRTCRARRGIPVSSCERHTRGGPSPGRSPASFW
mmetsp:Transcript_12650/g.41987  ORF Transcript_12650/g.41987 Transcript_12650/m.41987 type:complete len:305 (+) Transcript_12650:684-1598(+)